ncbi:Dihydrofolate reductase [Smittium culicis]|uniref:Dihydrofolate reductase n=1 Tax=Smittium culicis TaxID=133412 RepID=A0A1R1XQB3_9FUNG|nr:Dihydrofolate reductase [Smittium culicis]
MILNLIAAVNQDYGIGLDGNLPWAIKNDMKFFANVTRSELSDPYQSKNQSTSKEILNACIMGRLCWCETKKYGRKLPGRINIVITSDPEIADEVNALSYCKSVSSFQEALDYVEYLKSKESTESYTVRNIFIIGGYGVYKAAMETENAKVRIFYTNVITVDPIRFTAFFPALHKYPSFKKKSFENLQSLLPFTVEKGILEQPDGIRYEFQLYENWD